MAESDNIRWI